MCSQDVFVSAPLRQVSVRSVAPTLTRCLVSRTSPSHLSPWPLPQVNIRSMNLERALALLALPRDLGAHPDSNERVLVAAGQFGPFLKCGKVSRSVPAVSQLAWGGEGQPAGALTMCAAGGSAGSGWLLG